MFSSPGAFFEAINNKITKQQRLAFLSTVITGFLCHLFIYTNSMYNNDDIRYLHVSFDKPELGRWLLTYAAGISSWFSLPVVNGILGLIYAGAAVMLMVELLDIDSKVNAILVGAIVITFPTVACLNAYMFAVDPFLLSMAIAAGAALLVCKGKHRFSWLLGAALLCLSVAIYQAYLPLTLLLMLLYYILLLVNPQVEDGFLIKKGLQYLAMLAVGMGAYYIGMQAVLKLKNMSLSQYQGVGESSFPGPARLIERMGNALRDFIDFFKPDQVMALNGWLRAGLIITIVIIIASFLILAIKGGLFKSPLRIVLLLFAACCIPFAVNVIWLISDGVSFHMLMRHPFVLLYVAALVTAQRALNVLSRGQTLNTPGGQTPNTPGGQTPNDPWGQTPKFIRILYAVIAWGSAGAVALVAWNFIILSNIAYFNMNFRYEKTYALCIKIVDRMEQMEDYDRHRPIAFVGDYSKTYYMDELEPILEPMTGMKGKRVFGGASRNYLPFMQNCLGEDIEVVDQETEAALHEDPRFKEMPRFPEKGSIKVIDDITVIKLND